LSTPDRRRSGPRITSHARILWSVEGAHDIRVDRLQAVTASGGVVQTEESAQVGVEIRFDLLDDDGERFASGLAKVSAVDGDLMHVSFAALGIDPYVLAALGVSTASTTGRERPPPLPGVGGGPPPMPVGFTVPPKAARLSDPPADDVMPVVEPLAVNREPLHAPAGAARGAPVGRSSRLGRAAPVSG
jgi:hypothetical protein